VNPLRVGLAGAGPWAAMFHAPMLARSADVELAGIWARRLSSAEELARRCHTQAYPSLEKLASEVPRCC
jgi:predicted dehydrogenase